MSATAETGERPLRVVVSKVGLDGHDRGAKVIAKGFRDAGMEVIYTGLRRSPEDLAEIVLQEDADVLGLSILSGAVLPLTRRVLAALEAQDLSDVVVLVGGIVGPEEIAELEAAGVSGAFGPGSSMAEIVERVKTAAPASRRYGG
jgi:methylmalonyl-CoA mutase C-terminal domain/subunit